MLIIGALVLVGIWGASAIFRNVSVDGFVDFERSIMLALREADDVSQTLGPHWLEQTAIDWTALGGVPVLCLLLLISIGYLLLIRRPRTAVFLLLATSGGIALSFYLKTVFYRPRPDFLQHLANVSTTSFPSAHAMASCVVYLTIGSLLAHTTPVRREKHYFMGAAALLTIVIGLTRVYLGVHFPSDVVAGWAIGLVWVLICHAIMIQLQRRHLVESRPAPLDCSAREKI